ncbi:hypothetical protein HYALB_00005116 [Hymenoscyphus albidus]|uniref:F-box domain-containing protein n=1 Tax=Hymenoscyphus albidus TaxID=595503 RepID=A0A9N9QBJ0_9HELO|nr:hypothetical protein HYALB_00005116 [Hymenoscyphus albidus]
MAIEGSCPSLLELLSVSVVLDQTSPYLPITSLLALAATSKSFRSLIHHTPGVFRRLDLTQCKRAKFEIAAIDNGGQRWRNVQMDENVTEEDFYGGPLMAILNALRRQNILQDVQTLILDGLSVTSDMVHDIICGDSTNVRILSIREVRHLNERKLQQALQYAVRASRPPHTPKLEALYIFGPKDPVPHLRTSVERIPSGVPSTNSSSAMGGVMHSEGAQIGARWNHISEGALTEELKRGDRWYQRRGKVLVKPQSHEWASTIMACQGIISFDAVLCNGPRHSLTTTGGGDEISLPWYKQQSVYIPPRIATYSLDGCCKCSSAPEAFSNFGISPMDHFPLLSPPPLHSFTTKSAKAPSLEDSPDKKLLLRCIDCMQSRRCDSCEKWWCEDCYDMPYATLQPAAESGKHGASTLNEVKVHMGLCVENCLVAEMMSGAGSNGMWG